MNVLFVAAREINSYIGGIEKVTYTLTKELIQLGQEVYWLALEKSRWQSLDENNIATQYYIPNSQNIQSDENVLYIRSLIDRNHIDIVVNQATIRNDSVDLCSKVKFYIPVKIISVIHFAPRTEYDIAKNNLFLLKGDKSLKNILSKTFDFIYFVFLNSQKLKNQEKKLLIKICQTSNSVVLLSNGFIPAFKKIYNSDKYQAISNPICVETSSFSQKKKQVLYVARIEYGAKRFDRMLNVWDKVGRVFPDWRLIVVGDGDYLPHFKRFAEKHNIENITFVGFTDPKPYYESSSVLCLTSTSEGFGMVLLEAMQYGCVPVVYNSYASLSDVINDGVDGFSVAPFDENEFITKLSRLMRDDVLRQEMAQKSFFVPPKFDSRIIAREWVALFDSLS